MKSTLLLHIRLGGAYLAQFLKTRMEYRADVITGLLGTLTLQIVGLLFIEVLFQQVRSLNEWSRAEVFLIYGIGLIPMSIFSAFFSNLYFFSSTYIVEGNFDRILLRPLNTLFQICLERIRIESRSGVITGHVVVGYASTRMDPPLTWSLANILLLFVFTLAGVAILIGLFVGCSSLSFWFTDRIGLLPPLYNMIAFGRYPLNIYDPRLQWILTWVLPFAFIGFFPATHFLQREHYRLYVILTPFVAAAVLFLGLKLWDLGTRRYESTGS